MTLESTGELEFWIFVGQNLGCWEHAHTWDNHLLDGPEGWEKQGYLDSTLVHVPADPFISHIDTVCLELNKKGKKKGCLPQVKLSCNFLPSLLGNVLPSPARTKCLALTSLLPLLSAVLSLLHGQLRALPLAVPGQELEEIYCDEV